MHNTSSPSQWKYVNTQSNPADDASRGVPAASLHHRIHGLVFLTQSSETWPQRPSGITNNIPDDDPEVKAETAAYSTEISIRDPIALIIERFSSWSHLKKVVAWIFQYKTNLQHLVKNQRAGESPKIKSSRAINSISVTELNSAEVKILKYVQSQSFKQQYKQTKSTNRQSGMSNHRDLKKSSSIYKLDPVLAQGLRVGGCLR